MTPVRESDEDRKSCRANRCANNKLCPRSACRHQHDQLTSAENAVRGGEHRGSVWIEHLPCDMPTPNGARHHKVARPAFYAGRDQQHERAAYAGGLACRHAHWPKCDTEPASSFDEFFDGHLARRRVCVKGSDHLLERPVLSQSRAQDVEATHRAIDRSSMGRECDLLTWCRLL